MRKAVDLVGGLASPREYSWLCSEGLQGKKAQKEKRRMVKNVK